MTICVAIAAALMGGEPSLEKLAVLVAPDGDGFEIVAHAARTDELWTTRKGTPRLTRIDLSDLANPTIAGEVDLRSFGVEVTSVATNGDLVAASVLADPSTDAGTVVLLNLEGAVLGSHRAGAHPDMVVFSPDGTRLLVANEGEPAGGIDPPGTVTVFRLENAGVVDRCQLKLGMTSDQSEQPDVTWFTPLAETPARMVEPEYIAVTEDGSRAVVAAQENNGFAVLDLEVWPPNVIAQHNLGILAPAMLGAIDIVDDGRLAPMPSHLAALPQPDSIAVVVGKDGPVVFSADEGDPREVWGIDGAIKRNGLEQSLELQGGQGVLFGGRGLSAWTLDGTLLDRATSPVVSWVMAKGHASLATRLDSRSDRRGEEPEGLVAWQDAGRVFLACGFERAGAVGLFEFVDNELVTLDIARVGNESSQVASPEGLAVLEQDGHIFVVVADESGGTLSIFQVAE